MNIGIHKLEEGPNYAIDKIILHHENLKDNVEKYDPLKDRLYDKIYCSSIFTFTPKDELLIDDRWDCGGTGFDVYKELPPEIESLMPKNNYGFCSRGCIRNCKFCVVPQKEGKIREYADIYDIWDGKSKEILLQDNNILALPDHFYRICEQVKKEKLKVDFNQGLDIRLLDADFINVLSSIRHEQYHFAFDTPGLDLTIFKNVKLLKNAKINRSTFYVLVGCDTTPEEDLYRLNLLRLLGQNAYVMRYRKVFEGQPEGIITEENIKFYTALCRWANNHSWFQALTFREWLKVPDQQKRYKKHEVVMKWAS